ncbi:hypothetical protein HaLaN_32932 [Haematococcus lacustris]|uniref:Uncharacterized protein n=1 Tax=Haematococcus lacustris TaxID=44745 RepID=A0A6A0ANV3_HAELA|nr:hypothetical protein HaLaN_32932 [Haematococcus lacustris]
MTPESVQLHVVALRTSDICTDASFDICTDVDNVNICADASLDICADVAKIELLDICTDAVIVNICADCITQHLHS